MLIGLVEGIFIGAGVAVSRYFGAGDREKMSVAIHTDVAFSLAAGLALTIIGTVFSDDILRRCCDAVIDNSGEFSDTMRQIDGLLAL